MKNLYKILCATMALGVLNTVKGQDIHFSQFFETPLYRNPALAGIVTGDIRVQAVFRSQWNSVVNAYKTVSLNAEYKIPVGRGNDYITCGLEAFYDRSGSVDLSTTIIMPVINYHKLVSNTRNVYLSAAFMGGFVDRRFDISKITTNNQYDGGGHGENVSKSQYSYWDGIAGVSLNSELGNNPENNYVVGIAYHHFNSPKNSFYENAEIDLQPKWVFSADLKAVINDRSWGEFHSDYSLQGSYREWIAGALYGIKLGPEIDNPEYTLQAGALLRWKDAVIPVVKIGYQPFTIAFSYDVNISKFKTTSYGRGGAELSISYIGFTKRNDARLRESHCPRF